MNKRCAGNGCLVLVLLSCLVGCDAPMAKQPFGSRWQSADVSKLTGHWVMEGEADPVAFFADRDGEGQAAFVQAEPDSTNPLKNNLKLDVGLCVFTRVGKHELFFYKSKEKPEPKENDKNATPDGYSFLLISKREPHKLTLAIPSLTLFTQLVQSGKLPGKMYENSRVKYPMIDCDEQAFQALIDEHGIDKCFETKAAIVLEKLVKKKKTP